MFGSSSYSTKFSQLISYIYWEAFDILCLVFLELPQLRSVTSMELGCDARGYSRAGYDTMTWYCVILAGRQSLELNKMREVSFFPLMLLNGLSSR